MEQYFTLDNASKKFGINISSFRKLLKNYSDIKDAHVKKLRLEGDKKKKMYISKKGMVLLANAKSDERNKTSKSALNASLKVNKMEIAEKAIAYDKLMNPSNKELLPAQALLQSVQLMVQMEGKVQDLSNQVRELKQGSEEAQQKLFALPESDVEPKEISIRSRIRQRVNKYARAQKVSYSDIWHRLYSELYYRYNVNVTVKAKNRGIMALDIVEEEGMMNDLWSISCSMLKIN
jgi:hypothetical protein|tara:strand:- start:21261 stop:21962 length:702 start_codon:yes stop_codon:yes gene_type:complete